MKLVEVRALEVSAGATGILHDVSLSVEAGEVLAIVGPNGAGKSTLLGAIAGNLPPSRGSISLFGTRLEAWPELLLARRRAVVAQSSALSLPFLVEDVVALGRAPFADEDPEIIRAALDATGMHPFAKRIYPSLSGGERQRVHIARAIAQLGGPDAIGPRLLLLDEPTSALDLEQQHRCLDGVRALAKNGVAVIVVLHALDLSIRYADRIAVMQGGRIVADGSPLAVVEPALLRSVFRVEAELVTLGPARHALVVERPSDPKPRMEPTGER